MNTEEDEFKRIEREALRRAAFQRKVDNAMRIAFKAAWDDDDTQVYASEVALAEAYRCGYQHGMEAAAVICENLPVQQEVDVRDECAAAIRERKTT